MNRLAIIIWIGVAAVSLIARRAVALPPPSPQPGDNLRVFVLTFGPGDDPWEKYGHNAIRIVDDARDDVYHDLAWHWGKFDFDHKVEFVWHFVQGRLIYEMGVSEGQPTIEDYEKILHRGVQQQQLNLTGSQKIALQRQLLRDYGNEKLRHYRYDYYTNNCSSRVRDVVDDLVDHRLMNRTRGVPSDTSYRFHTDRLDAETLWLYVALQGVLGHPVDQPIDLWDEMFLPEKVHDRLNEVKIDRGGTEVPLVLSDEILFQSPRPPEPAKPPMMAPRLLVIGMLFGGVLVALGRYARRHRAARWGFVLVSTPWFLLMGLGGSFLWWAWLATDHVVARYNENVMHVSALALPLLVMMPSVAFGRRFGKVWALRLTWAMAGISVIGLLLKVLPWFYQVNYSIIAMCLPVNLALAYAVWVMGKSPAAKVEKAHVRETKIGAKARS